MLRGVGFHLLHVSLFVASLSLDYHHDIDKGLTYVSFRFYSPKANRYIPETEVLDTKRHTMPERALWFNAPSGLIRYGNFD